MQNSKCKMENEELNARMHAAISLLHFASCILHYTCVRSSHAPTSFANVDRSMLPPDTIATMRPRTRPLSAAATAQAPAPSATTWHRSATSFMASATSDSGTTIDSLTTVDSSGHIVGST